MAGWAGGPKPGGGMAYGLVYGPWGGTPIMNGWKPGGRGTNASWRPRTLSELDDDDEDDDDDDEESTVFVTDCANGRVGC
nr:hypothetical protein BaRGS_029741 [Batillaria attramentaria]